MEVIPAGIQGYCILSEWSKAHMLDRWRYRKEGKDVEHSSDVQHKYGDTPVKHSSQYLRLIALRLSSKKRQVWVKVGARWEQDSWEGSELEKAVVEKHFCMLKVKIYFLGTPHASMGGKVEFIRGWIDLSSE